MSSPLPNPQSLAQRYINSLSQKNFKDENGSSVRLDPASPGTFEQVLSGVLALADYETYLYQQDLFKELLPTTATEKGLLPQHGTIWSVPRRGAQKAVGYMLASATQDVVIPQGALVTSDGSVQWKTKSELKLYAYVPGSVAIECLTAGESGNLAPNTDLNLVNPIAGISSVVSDDEGFTGGDDIEPAESWRSRIIASIRYPYGGGTKQDYLNWATDAGADFVNVVPSYWGAGTVGVIVALDGGVAPTEAKIAEIQAYIDARRPVRGNVVVFAAKILPQIIKIKLDPDTDAARQAVNSALSPLILSVGIGGTLYFTALENAIYTASGAKSKLISPSDDVAFNPDEMPILDHVEWVAS